MTEELKPSVNKDLLFPVLGGRDVKFYVPMDFVEPHEQQAQRNHSQSLKRLAERGGLSPCELLAVIEDRDWRKIGDAEAWMSIFGHYRAFVSRTKFPPEEVAILKKLLERAKFVLERNAEILDGIDREAAESCALAIRDAYGESECP